MSSSFIGKVLDSYRIIERLGIGGMGVVFKAIHIKLDKVFAIKIIAPGLAMNEHFIKRFQTEAKALAKFEDPNIVRIYDLRSIEDQWFIVMEYVEGTTLTDKILQDGAFQWLDTVPIIKQVLNAIGHAHEAGIIHRDIKPNNIMISEKGIVKITDFGLAKDQTKSTNTISVTSGGTLYYMSPEHVKGFSFIDARSDLYSIGMTCYEMLTGIVPFANMNSDFDIRESIIRKDFDKPRSINPTIPSELEMIIMKSINKNPDDRYQTADDMIQAIKNFESQYGLADGEQIEQDKQAPEPVLIKESSSQETEDHVTDTNTEPIITEKKKPLLKWIAALIVLAIITIIALKIDSFIYTPVPAVQSGDANSSSKLTISSTPSNAYISLNGNPLGETPFTSDSLQAGQYSLKIHKENYNTIDTTLNLTESSDLAVLIALKKIHEIPSPVTSKKDPVKKSEKPANVVSVLSIYSEPSDSEIWLNGKLSGRSPIRSMQLTPGTYSLEIRRTGFEKYTRNLILNTGNNQKINATLIPFNGGLSVIKDPSSATVLVDGEVRNKNNSPVMNLTGLSIGKHTIKVTNQGYETFEQEIEIKQNEIYTLNANLVRREGNLSIQVRPWGSIYINGELQESTADIKHTFRLPVDQYDINVEHPTLGFWQKRIQIDDKKDKDVIVNFTKQLKIQIKALDELNSSLDGNIFVDGKSTGQITPGVITLRTGVHKIEIKKEGYLTEGGEKLVLINSGMDQTITFKLLRK